MKRLSLILGFLICAVGCFAESGCNECTVSCFTESDSSKCEDYRDASIPLSLFDFNLYKLEKLLEADFKKVENYTGSQLSLIAYSQVETVILKKVGPFRIRCTLIMKSSFENLSNSEKEAVLKIIYEYTIRCMNLSVSKEIKPEHVFMKVFTFNDKQKLTVLEWKDNKIIYLY